MSKIENIREWMYVDKSGTPKGPVPTAILTRLLDKGLGVSGDTMAWKTGMDMWKRLAEIDEFRSLAEFQEMKWYYLEADGQQRGPISSRLLLHKIKSGDIDGLTMVFTPSYIEWKKLSDVTVLREAMHKIAREEEESAKAMAMIPQEEQVFDVEDVQNFVPFSELTSNQSKESRQVVAGVTQPSTEVKSSFVADNGIRYTWDSTEQCWVEDDDEEGVDEDEDESQLQHQQQQQQDDDDDEEELIETEKDITIGDGEKKKTQLGQSNNKEEEEERQKRKRKRKNRKKSSAANNNNWIYVTGLPKDVTQEEIKAHFSKVGLIAINPLDQLSKIKLYKDVNTGELKGDCSICYNAEESVTMAIEVFHEGYLRPNYQLSVTKANFQDKLTDISTTKRTKSNATRAQVKVAQSAIAQALAWNEEDDIGISKKQGLKIIVLEGMFHPSDFEVESFLNELEQDVANGCQIFGEIEKITVFSKNPKGIVIVKFKTTFAAQECIKSMDGRYFGGRKLKSFFWDGSTNYSVSSGTDQQEAILEKEEEERIDEFGDWLDKEQEDLPEEFKLRKE